ncbi:hypothetical protein DPMN_067804 [Dreissena polymorpha]|uniref:Uncharacterized protein n=1 Tax=Dreissena polymorpha TaxID=45954 RepID=A0A9D3Z0F0_DREPO|nr:hypothetical protein DPMN_067804 [Dreissena polymorpha]
MHPQPSVGARYAVNLFNFIADMEVMTKAGDAPDAPEDINFYAPLRRGDDAEDVVQSLGGELDITSSCIISWLMMKVCPIEAVFGENPRNAEEQQIETDDFVEDSYDYDNDADYISSEESDSDCKGTVYPERDTVNIYVEESLNVIQGDGDKEQWKSTRLQIWMSSVGILLLA